MTVAGPSSRETLRRMHRPITLLPVAIFLRVITVTAAAPTPPHIPDCFVHPGSSLPLDDLASIRSEEGVGVGRAPAAVHH